MNIIAIDCGASFIKAGLIADGNLIKEIKKSTPNVMEDISEQVGFSSGAYFSRVFKELEGISPLRFRKAKEHRP